MTNTILLNAVTVAAGQGVNPTKTSFQSATTGYSVNITVSAFTIANPGSQIRIYVASSSVSVTAAVGVTQFIRSAANIDVTPTRLTATTQNFPLLARLGDYLYVWLDVPNFTVMPTVTVNLWENA